MASAKKTLNPLTDTPTNKVEITKPFMLAYMRQVASEEDKAWFKKIVADEISQFLASFQSRLAEADDEMILRKLTSSEQLMNQEAGKVLYCVQQAVGLRKKD